MSVKADNGQPVLVEHADLDVLVRVLRDEGYTVVGPSLRDGAIALTELTGAGELPTGWGVEAGAGRYRVVARTDEATFAHSAGPQSWKSYLHPAHEQLLTGSWDETGMVFRAAAEPPPRYAFLGVRPCDLAAMGVLDGVLSRGAHPDPGYTARRDGTFVIAVNCTEPGAACFCVSMGGGPRANAGYDLALTERLDDAGHRYLVEVGTEAGRRILDLVPHRPAKRQDTDAADADLDAAADRMGRETGRAMPDVDLRRLLLDSRESPHWDDVASRCLSCANCTMVCPTCFCTTTEDVTDLTGDHAERWRRWDSCFDLDFSYIHGGEVRAGTGSRYRQWISHKLSSWHDQFGSSGCVGCGRCIAWCPAGIDITVEAGKLADLAAGAGEAGTND